MLKEDNHKFYSTTHLIVEDESDLQPEVEDIGKESIRIVYDEGGHRIALTLGEKKALFLSHIIDTYFQDKNR